MQKIFEKLKNQWTELKNHPITLKFQKKVLPIILDFLLTGPSLIGYTLELWIRPPDHLRFHLAMQSFFIFFVYLNLMLLAEFICYILDDKNIILYIRSFLAFSYLCIGLISFSRLRRGKPLNFLEKMAFYKKWVFHENSSKNFT